MVFSIKNGPVLEKCRVRLSMVSGAVQWCAGHHRWPWGMIPLIHPHGQLPRDAVVAAHASTPLLLLLVGVQDSTHSPTDTPAIGRGSDSWVSGEKKEFGVLYCTAPFHMLFDSSEYFVQPSSFLCSDRRHINKKNHWFVVTKPGGQLSSSRGTRTVKGCVHAKVGSLTAEQPLWLYWKIILHFLALVSWYQPGKNKIIYVCIFLKNLLNIYTLDNLIVICSGNKACGDLSFNKYGINQTDINGGISHAYLKKIFNEEGHL